MSAEDTTLWMERAHLRDLPASAAPAGYRIRAYRPGDAAAWTMIQREADRFARFDEGTFGEQFAADEAVRQQRIFFAEDRDGLAVGTVAAWYGKGGPTGDEGLIHWFAVLPAHQRRGIGRSLLAHALRVMATMHQRALLETDSNRVEAVKLYRDFGFVRTVAS